MEIDPKTATALDRELATHRVLAIGDGEHMPPEQALASIEPLAELGEILASAADAGQFK